MGYSPKLHAGRGNHGARGEATRRARRDAASTSPGDGPQRLPATGTARACPQVAATPDWSSARSSSPAPPGRGRTPPVSISITAPHAATPSAIGSSRSSAARRASVAASRRRSSGAPTMYSHPQVVWVCTSTARSSSSATSWPAARVVWRRDGHRPRFLSRSPWPAAPRGRSAACSPARRPPSGCPARFPVSIRCSVDALIPASSATTRSDFSRGVADLPHPPADADAVLAGAHRVSLPRWASTAGSRAARLGGWRVVLARQAPPVCPTSPSNCFGG